MCIINETPEIQFHQTTRSTPEQFVAGLIDFGPERSNLFSNRSDEYPKVHHLGWPGGLSVGRHVEAPTLRLVQ